MLGKAKQRASRVGCRPVKIHFSVRTHSLSLPLGCLVADQAVLSISFERKTKSVATGSFVHKISVEKNENIVAIPETLELVTVLFLDTRSKQFQKKTAKLVLRELSKQGLFGHYSYKVIGRCDLHLHQLANEMGREASVTRTGIVVFDNLKGVVLKFSVVATVQSVDGSYQYLETNDTASEVSDASDMSELTSASFKDPLPDSFLMFEALAPPVGSYLDSVAGAGPGAATEGNDRIDEENENDRSPSAHSLQLRSELSSPRLSTSTASSDRLLSAVPDHSTTRHVFVLYDQALRRRGEYVTLLERQLAELTVQASVATAPCEQSAHSPHSTHSSHNKSVGQAKEVSMRNELEASRHTEERLRLALQEELRVAREAAAVAASSAVLRAEAEDECQSLLSDLITLKMNLADASMVMDSLTHENRTLVAELKRLRESQQTAEKSIPVSDES